VIFFFKISGELYFYKKKKICNKTDLLEPKLFFLPKNSLARQCNKKNKIYASNIFVELGQVEVQITLNN
jgi:hypothetical protein